MKGKYLQIWSILFVLCNQMASGQSNNSEEKPNIIFIMTDDLGYGDLGIYGQKRIKTPNIDRLGAEGIKFNQHYSGSTVCMPSRAVLMTGYHTGHNSVRGNPRWTTTGKPIDLDSKDVTIAEELKRRGYRTAIIGKWGLAEANPESMPLNQGFDYFFGYRKHGKAHHYYPDTLYENNDPFYTGNLQHEKIGIYSHDQFIAKSLQFINVNKENPFFLYLALTIPHFELTVPEGSKMQYRNLGWPLRTLTSRRGGYQHDKDANVTYAGMVSRMDRDVGRIMELLKDLKIEENTLIIFTSDNGHEYDNGFFNSNGELRGHKRDLYEGGIRVPFLAKWPDYINAGSETNHISAFWDFLPTICEIVGIEPTKHDIDGISYLPTLVNSGVQKNHEYLYWEFNEWQGPVQAIRKENWKAIRNSDDSMELYNLKTDLGEQHNIADTYPVMIKEFEKLMKEARTPDLNFVLEPHERLKKN